MTGGHYISVIQWLCPELLDVPYENNSDFSEETKEYVKNLCKKFKNKTADFETIDMSAFIENSRFIRSDDSSNIDTSVNGEEYLYSVFIDEQNKNLFINEFGEFGKQIYDYAKEYYEDKDNFISNQFIVPIVSIMEFLNIIVRHKEKETLEYLMNAYKRYPDIEQLRYLNER